MTTSKEATFIRRIDGFHGDARLYTLTVAVPYFAFGANTQESLPIGDTKFVVVAAEAHRDGHGVYLPLTTVWAVDEKGRPIGGGDADLDTERAPFCLSIAGFIDHRRALNMLGLTVTADTLPANPDDVLQAALREENAGSEYGGGMPEGLAALLMTLGAEKGEIGKSEADEFDLDEDELEDDEARTGTA